jgi:ribosomal protein S6--L-glutamate ligase
MRILVLSRNSDLYSTRRLVEAGAARGHKLTVVDPLRCYIGLSARQPEVHYMGKSLAAFDAVIPRVGASITFYGTAVVRQFEVMGVYSVNESVAIQRARDKLRSLQLLARASIEMPRTAFAHTPDDSRDALRLVGNAPAIIKLLEGTQGVGVVLAESRPSAISAIDTLRSLDAYFLIQEFIQEAKGTDIRCFVIGRRVVAAMLRKGRKDEFRSNIHRGGTGVPVKILKEERALAVRATHILGLNVAGVDIIRSARGPLVLEVNSSPGLKGIERASKMDIATEIIKFIEKHARPGRTRTRGTG